MTVPVLGVRDVTAAAEYWRDVLGFDLDPEHGVIDGTDDEPGGIYAVVSRRGSRVHFEIRRRGSVRGEHDRERIETDYVFVDDVDSLYDELRERGADVWGPPTVAPYGLREIRVEDGSGHRITFGCPAPP